MEDFLSFHIITSLPATSKSSSRRGPHVEVHDNLCCRVPRMPLCDPEVAGAGQAMLYLCLRIKQLICQPRATEAETQCKAIFIFLFCPTDFCFGGEGICCRGGPKVSFCRFVNGLLCSLARTAEKSISCTQQLPLSALRMSHVMLLPELSCKVWQRCHQSIQTLSP